jgi:uncharacterized protein (TIGR03382 family)
MKVQIVAIAALSVLSVSTPAFAGYVVTQTLAAPTQYTEKTANFDEAFAFVGAQNPYTSYSSINGLTVEGLNGGCATGNWNALHNMNGGFGSLGNSIYGGLGISLKFNKDIDALSFQGWADGSSGFQAGMSVFIKNDGVQVGNAFFASSVAFGSNANLEKSWYNVTGTDGAYFDEIVFYNAAFNSFTTYADNLSWENIPAPGAMALLGLAGAVARRRRRA